MVNSQPNLYNYGREVAKPLESIVKDQIYDDQDPLTTDSEVHLKKVFDPNTINFELLEKYLVILSRVFKT